MRVGSDPEVFITNSKGVILPAIGHIGGSKAYPRDIAGGAVQEDNIMAELNPLASVTKRNFIHNLTTVMVSLDRIIKSSFSEDARISQYTSGNITEIEATNPLANLFGCDVDFCSWTEKENDKIILTTTDRYCGGHLHISDSRLTKQEDQVEFAKLCDKFLGVPAVVMDPDSRRYKVYGKAGMVRFKPTYPGIEYRTLSNFWIFKSYLMEWVWDQLERTMDAFINKQYITQKEGELIQRCINTKDLDLSYQLVDESNLTLVLP